MLSIAQINSRFANLGLGIEVRRHQGGGFYLVSTRSGQDYLIDSALSHDSVNEWAACRLRDFYRVHVEQGAPYYPGGGRPPVYHYAPMNLRGRGYSSVERAEIEARYIERWGHDPAEARHGALYVRGVEEVRA